MRPNVRHATGGALAAGIGYALVAGSAFALLAATPRLVDAELLDAVGLIWIIVNVFGYGLAFPTEQLLNRHGNTFGSVAPLRPMLILTSLGAVPLSAALVLDSSGVAHAHVDRLLGVSVGVIGWILTAYTRGRLAAIGNLRGYTLVLVSEAAARVTIVGASFVFPAHAFVVLTAAVGVPILVGASVGLALLRVGDHAKGPEPSQAPFGEHLAYILISLGLQATINAAPAAIAGRNSMPAGTLGAFVSASTYYRAPSVIVGGLAVHALATLGDCVYRADWPGFRDTAQIVMRRQTLVCVSALAALVVAAPVILRLYFGRDPGLPGAVTVGLAVSTIAVCAALVQTQSLLALGSFGLAAGAWVISASATVVPFVFLSKLDYQAAFALTVGPTIALAIALVDTSRLLAKRIARSPDPGVGA